MQQIVRYEVIDKKGRWMGSYSPVLDKNKNRGSALEMAKTNARHSNGTVFEVYQDDTRKQVYPN